MSFIRSVLKTGDLGSIRRKLITLYIMNITDIILTILLINTGSFLEANTIMAPLVNNKQLLSITVKVVMPFVLLLGIYQRMKEATEKQLYQSNIIINGCLILYGIINISHVVCSTLYIIL